MSESKGPARPAGHPDPAARPPSGRSRNVQLVASKYLYIGEMKILDPPEPIKPRKSPRSK